MPPSSPLSRRQRLATALTIGALVALAVLVFRATRVDVRVARPDIDLVWFAARTLLAGADPYVLAGPGREFQWPWPLYYPATAAVVVIPLAGLPFAWAHAAFSGGSAALLAYGLTRDGLLRVPVFASAAFLHAVILGQWAPLLTAALFLPALGGVFAAKPTIGAALFAARPSRAAVAGGLVLLAVSLVLHPTWPLAWIEAARGASQLRAPAGAFGGAGWLVVLAAATRWRRPEARLIAALACVPQTPNVAEALPILAFVPGTRPETLLLTAASYLALTVPASTATYDAWLTEAAARLLLCVYLPAAVLVLRRPNEGPAPAVLARALARWRVPAWLAGRPAVE